MLRLRAQRGLSRVMVRGTEHLAPWDSGGGERRPLLIVANHSSWWDAVLPVLLSLDVLSLDAHGLMDAVQLKRYGLFRRVGLLPVDRSNRRRALLSLDAVAEEMRDRGRVLWLFPQGQLLPAEVRPLGCEPGAAWLVARLGGCAVVPVAFRYEPCAHQRHEAYLGIGEPRWFPSHGGLRATTSEIERMLTAQLDLVREEVATGRTEDYRPLIS